VLQSCSIACARLRRRSEEPSRDGHPDQQRLTPAIELHNEAARGNDLGTVDDGRELIRVASRCSRGRTPASLCSLRYSAAGDAPRKAGAVWGRSRQGHPAAFSCCKFFFICDIVGGTAGVGPETLDVGWSAESELPEKPFAQPGFFLASSGACLHTLITPDCRPSSTGLCRRAPDGEDNTIV